MRDQIDIILKSINNSLKIAEPADISLMTGHAGIALFYYLYGKHKGTETSENGLDQSIQELAESSIVEMHPSFCTGKSGVNWLFTFLYHNDVISKTDRDFLCDDDDDRYEEIALFMLKNSNYDFLHGAIGIAYYLLYSNTYKNPGFFHDILNGLNALIDESHDRKMIPYFDGEKGALAINQVNMGLAHGLPSVLKFCLQCYNQNICPAQAKSLAILIIDYLKNHTNSDKSLSCYSSIITENKSDWEYSRLAWCYGDLGIGYIIYQAGIIFQDQTNIDFGLGVLKNSTKRRSLEETSANDCGICHGSAGIAHIYNKIWQSTRQPIFKEACDFWVKKTLEFLAGSDWLKGYQKYDGRSKALKYDNALLEGSAGIGLVLLSYLYEDFSWDYLLMLN